MVATPRLVLKYALRTAGWAFGGLATVIVLFVLSAWIGSSIPRNGDWVEPENGVEIMVESNGVHTSIVMPLVNADKDWRATFPAGDVVAADRPYTHISVSWGEREVFLNTPTWGDLSAMTVLRVIGLGGDGLIHVYHYDNPTPGENLRPLTLSREQYRRLVAEIERQAPTRSTPRHEGYGARDVFYDAPGRYTVTKTCNQWASDTLARAGVKTGWWTPMAGGVMKWVPRTDR